MQDRRCVRGALVRGAPIEMVVEDGLDRAMGARADVDGALGGGFQTLGAIGTGQPNNAETSAKALFGMRTLFEDQFAERAVAGPIRRASARMRSIVQPAYRRWLDGMCSATGWSCGRRRTGFAFWRSARTAAPARGVRSAERLR